MAGWCLEKSQPLVASLQKKLKFCQNVRKKYKVIKRRKGNEQKHLHAHTRTRLASLSGFVPRFCLRPVQNENDSYTCPCKSVMLLLYQCVRWRRSRHEQLNRDRWGEGGRRWWWGADLYANINARNTKIKLKKCSWQKVFFLIITIIIEF